MRNYIKVKILSNVLRGHLSNNMCMLLLNSYFVMFHADNRRNLAVCIWKKEQRMPLTGQSSLKFIRSVFCCESSVDFHTDLYTATPVFYTLDNNQQITYIYIHLFGSQLLGIVSDEIPTCYGMHQDRPAESLR